MKMQGNTTEIDERNLLRLDALLSHGYGLSPQLVMRSKGLAFHGTKHSRSDPLQRIHVPSNLTRTRWNKAHSSASTFS